MTESKEIKKRGFQKGCPKSPGSGIKKGQKHKVKRIRDEMRYSPDLTQERYNILLNDLWEHAIYKKNMSAITLWLEEYHKHGSTLFLHLDMPLDTIHDINKASREITEKMFRNELSLSAAERMLGALSIRQKHIEGQLKPALERLLAQQQKELKQK